MLYRSTYNFWKEEKLRQKKKEIITIEKSARLSDKTDSWKECIQLIIHVYLFLRCKTL